MSFIEPLHFVACLNFSYYNHKRHFRSWVTLWKSDSSINGMQINASRAARGYWISKFLQLTQNVKFFTHESLSGNYTYTYTYTLHIYKSTYHRDHCPLQKFNRYKNTNHYKPFTLYSYIIYSSSTSMLVGVIITYIHCDSDHKLKSISNNNNTLIDHIKEFHMF